LKLKKHFLIFLAFLTLATAVARAQDVVDTCDPYPDVPVNVTPRFDEPDYDYSIDLAGLQALSSDPQHNLHGAHAGLTLGLTRYEPVMEFATPIKSFHLPGGLFCAHVDHVDVTFGYRNVTVYVPREIPQGSCGFDQVITHERKHIAVNQEILDEYAPQLADRIKDFLRLNGVFREENPDYAISEVKEKLQAIVDEIAKDVFTENARRQHEVDNPDEYRRVGESCQGQLSEAATEYRRKGQ
jgi:hypothetical protein